MMQAAITWERDVAIKTINPKESRNLYDQFHFSQAVRAGELLICSGQIGTGVDGKVPMDLADEFRNAWQKVGSVLAAAKFQFSDVIEYTSYHVGMQSTIGTFMKVRDEVLSEPWPAWTAIGITELAVPGAHVEIRVTARKRK
jgi:enamine deaminase RidA (YjgF/YER057c/UK114 family)